jgi:hypothetical protein
MDSIGNFGSSEIMRLFEAGEEEKKEQQMLIDLQSIAQARDNSNGGLNRDLQNFGITTGANPNTANRAKVEQEFARAVYEKEQRKTSKGNYKGKNYNPNFHSQGGPKNGGTKGNGNGGPFGPPQPPQNGGPRGPPPPPSQLEKNIKEALKNLEKKKQPNQQKKPPGGAVPAPQPKIFISKKKQPQGFKQPQVGKEDAYQQYQNQQNNNWNNQNNGWNNQQPQNNNQYVHQPGQQKQNQGWNNNGWNNQGQRPPPQANGNGWNNPNQNRKPRIIDPNRPNPIDYQYNKILKISEQVRNLKPVHQHRFSNKDASVCLDCGQSKHKEVFSKSYVKSSKIASNPLAYGFENYYWVDRALKDPQVITDNLYNPNNNFDFILLLIIKEKQDLIQYMKNPSERIQLAAIRQDIKYNLEHKVKKESCIRFFVPSDRVLLYAVKRDPDCIKYVIGRRKIPTKILLAAMSVDANVIKYIKKPNVKIQNFLVTKHWENIKFLKDPDPGIINKAIRENGLAIKFIPSKYLTNIRLLNAIDSNPECLRYISIQKPSLQRFFMSKITHKNYKLIGYLKKPNKEIQELIFKLRPSYLLLLGLNMINRGILVRAIIKEPAIKDLIDPSYILLLEKEFWKFFYNGSIINSKLKSGVVRPKKYVNSRISPEAKASPSKKKNFEYVYPILKKLVGTSTKPDPKGPNGGPNGSKGGKPKSSMKVKSRTISLENPTQFEPKSKKQSALTEAFFNLIPSGNPGHQTDPYDIYVSNKSKGVRF